MLLQAHGAAALFSVSYTTRHPRGREQEGVDYHFVSREAFQAMIDRNELLEWAEVHGERYGSHQRMLEQARAGKLVLFDIDVQGGASIKAKYPEAVTVFVRPPSFAELERRLRNRRTDSAQAIERRLAAALQEMERGCSSYDYLVVNERLEEAFTDLQAIVRAERLRRERTDLVLLDLWSTKGT
jgi:guanylate kinase